MREYKTPTALVPALPGENISFRARRNFAWRKALTKNPGFLFPSGSGGICGDWELADIPGPSGTIRIFALEAQSRSGDTLEVRVENELLRSQLIEQQRTLLLMQRTLEKAEKRLGEVLHVVEGLTEVTRNLQVALVQRYQGAICLNELLSGVVSRVVGDEVELTLETEDGGLRQVYHRKQFLKEELPQEGDNVVAHLFLSAEAAQRETHSEKDREFPELPKPKSLGVIELE
jgi:hypothetical protein